MFGVCMGYCFWEWSNSFLGILNAMFLSYALSSWTSGFVVNKIYYQMTTKMWFYIAVVAVCPYILHVQVFSIEFSIWTMIEILVFMKHLFTPVDLGKQAGLLWSHTVCWLIRDSINIKMMKIDCDPSFDCDDI